MRFTRRSKMGYACAMTALAMVWAGFAYGADVAAKPKVLILGDSISTGYTPYVVAALDGRAEVARPGVNCGPSESYLKNLDSWTGDTKWDVIHVNFGIWDNHYMKTPGICGTQGMFRGDEVPRELSVLERTRAIKRLGIRYGHRLGSTVKTCAICGDVVECRCSVGCVRVGAVQRE